MATVNWGLLTKSLVDDETIEEAIIRLIAAADLLPAHKASEIIDHLVASIVYDKLAEFSVDFRKVVGDQYMFMTCFESIDAWNASDYDPGGGIVNIIFDTKLYTAALTDYFCTLAAESDPGGHALQFANSPMFQTTVRLSHATSQEAGIFAGLDKQFGFLILNGVVYAINYDGANYKSTSCGSIGVDSYHIYRAEFDSVAGKIYFYINGVLKATHSQYLPTGSDAYLFQYYITTKSDVVRSLFCRDLLWAQKK
jgi:hypothetical protein